MCSKLQVKRSMFYGFSIIRFFRHVNVISCWSREQAGLLVWNWICIMQCILLSHLAKTWWYFFFNKKSECQLQVGELKMWLSVMGCLIPSLLTWEMQCAALLLSLMVLAWTSRRENLNWSQRDSGAQMKRRYQSCACSHGTWAAHLTTQGTFCCFHFLQDLSNSVPFLFLFRARWNSFYSLPCKVCVSTAGETSTHSLCILWSWH